MYTYDVDGARCIPKINIFCISTFVRFVFFAVLIVCSIEHSCEESGKIGLVPGYTTLGTRVKRARNGKAELDKFDTGK